MSSPSARTAHYRNDLRRLTAAIAAALGLFGALLVGVVAYAGWSANRNAVARERQLVENALDQSIIRVLNEQKSIAWWDDAVNNVAVNGLNLEWVDINFGLYLSETYGHAEVYVLDGENRPVYAWRDAASQGPAGYAARQEQFAPLVEEVRTSVRQYPRVRDQDFVESQSAYRDLLGARVALWGGHILTVDGRPSVVTAITIVPNIDMNLIQGRPHMLVSVAPIDEAFVSAIGQSLLIRDLTVSAEPPGRSGGTVEPFVTDEGVTAGYLAWTPRTPGRTLLVFILPLVALGVIGASALTWVMMLRLKKASGELADREQQSRHQALHDALSGLPNRHNFVERLQEALDDVVKMRNNAKVVVAYVDVDRFKDINDTMGHAAGDSLIMAVAERLGEVLAPDDFLARFGGDEFAVLRRAPGAGVAAELAERLQRAFDDTFDLYGQHVRMTATVGIAMAPDHGASPQELMRHADIALYQGKNHGRDRAMFFCAEMASEVERRREIELDLHAALAARELHMHYQPLVSCGDGRVTGVEALLRWRHAEKGDISPAVFVPIAEEAGLMPALGAYVLERVFEESKRWPDLEIAINLSPVQLRHVDLVEVLQELLAKHAVDPSRIVLEVTEGVLMESSVRNREVLDAVRKLGFKIALDDFGTGYSSLRYLCDFRFDKIKIDRAFVTGIHERKRALTIIQSVVTLGRGLGMEIVAEGVETEAEASVMRLVGVTELQGFFFSHAVPAQDVGELVKARMNAAPPARPAKASRRASS